MRTLFAWFGLVTLCFADEPSVPAWAKGEFVDIKLEREAVPGQLQISQTAKILRPVALTQAEELEKLNPGLLALLPGLRTSVGSASVSAKFKTLYDAKVKAIAEGYLMPAKYYFDCATVLHLTDAKSGRKAVLFQSDMDTDTDGSDGVRMSALKDYDDARLSRSYQPILAYSWARKESDTGSNPFPKYYSDTLGKLRGLQSEVATQQKQDVNPVWEMLHTTLEEQIASMSRSANYYRSDLKERRSLLASQDPFIVVPQTWVGEGSHGMDVGDYAAAIYRGKIYPCIIADTGPTTKAGEASQRLCRAITPTASGRVSAVTTPGVTYIVFPNTKGSPGVPDLAQYRSRLEKLLGELGGISSPDALHRW
jgi:hypothetical protein